MVRVRLDFHGANLPFRFRFFHSAVLPDVLYRTRVRPPETEAPEGGRMKGTNPMHPLIHPLNDTRFTPFIFTLAGWAAVFVVGLYFLVEAVS